MAEGEKRSGGVVESVRRIGGSLLALAHTRAELFSVEIQEERLRTFNYLLWVGAAVAFMLAGILVAVAAVALLLWNTAGYAGLAGLAIATLAVAALLVWALHRRIQREPEPFAGTVAEFRKDLECLRPRD